MASSAQTLKQEADRLFRRQKYSEALLKYRKAIKTDYQNPILFANSALCSLKIRHYLDAISDATKAVELDPCYAKAYSYLAKAQEAICWYRESERAWANALHALSSSHLTPEQDALKQACEHGYAECKRKMKIIKAQVEGKSENADAPYFCRVSAIAESTASDLQLQPNRSFSHAQRAFTTYLRATNNLQGLFRSSPLHGYEFECPLTDIVTVLHHDARMTRRWDTTWAQKISSLAECMNAAHDGWKDFKPDNRFRELVRERILRAGWEEARSALAVTIKAWIVHAMVAESPTSEQQAEYLARAIEVIKWACTLIPSGDVEQCHCCGGIFDPLFLLATQKLHLTALVQVATRKRTDMARHNQLLKDIFQEADEIIGLGSNLPRNKEDEVYATAFRDFPCGVALGAKGYYYWETARKHRSSRTNLQHYLRISADCYLKASTYFPKDDEYHRIYLQRVMECMLFYGATAGEQLVFLQTLETAIKNMRPVWGIGPAAISLAVVGDPLPRAVAFLKDSVAYGMIQTEDVLTFDYPDGPLFGAMMDRPLTF